MSSINSAQTVSTDNLIEFITQQMTSLNISLRATAKGIGISASFLSNILKGKISPSIKTCNQMADYFQVPRVYIYELMGWMDLAKNDQVDAGDQAFLYQLADNDKDFLNLAKSYANMSPEERKQFIRIMRAYKES